MRQALRRFSRLAALMLACAALGNAPPPSPAELFGNLFIAVQERRIFDDNKTFADAIPQKPPAEIMTDYRAAPPVDDKALRSFVLERFTVPGVNDSGKAGLRAHIRNLWPQLVRQPAPVIPGESRIALPGPYVVPGGRFREIYYWDSYFTMLGLAADGEHALVESMLDDFTSLIERFGHIPNGTRSYYVSRSQPPFFALMLDISKEPDAAVQARRLQALRSEYAFWMAGSACAGRQRACLRVVRMPDGSLLNRYWDNRDSPRDESFAEDRASANAASGRPSGQIYRDLRAAAESGWDFSSRWLADGRTLPTIRTTEVVPVDLNALLWAMERRIARGCGEAGDAPCSQDFAHRADRRKRAMDRFLWQAGEGRYADWLLAEGQPSATLSAATLYPLFVGMASRQQADAVAELTRAKLLAPGGLRTTLTRTGQQWDAPNGWAPLQWIAVSGLDRNGHGGLARTIAMRWTATVERTYEGTGKMLEKYDVEESLPGGGGEYPLQDGFGWTNGVASALLDRYPALERAAP